MKKGLSRYLLRRGRHEKLGASSDATFYVKPLVAQAVKSIRKDELPRT